MERSMYENYSIAQQQALQDDGKYNEFLERLKSFSEVSTLSEAKDLATKIMPTSQEKTTFYIGSAKCVVINTSSSLRISIDSAKEFICYDFQ